MDASIIICTHNPDQRRLRATLEGLRAQNLASDRWETILVNNASTRFPGETFFADCAPPNPRIVPEPVLGLTAARRRGLREARGEVIVFADDDNILAPDYLQQTLAAFARLSRVGALGGKSLPVFEDEPPDWSKEFFSLLALRDLGENELLSEGLRPPDSDKNAYPNFAPIGAGMAIRSEAARTWLVHDTELSDRRGGELSSSGDNDIVLTIMTAGWSVAYIPQLSLSHLIPAARLDPTYLARLNRGIQKSWMQVLLAHNACPWPPIPRWSVPLRKLKAWFVQRAWSGDVERIRWKGACGHFEGRVGLRPNS